MAAGCDQRKRRISSRDLIDYMDRLKKAIDNLVVKVVQCKLVEKLVLNSGMICTTYALYNNIKVGKGEIIL